MLKSIYTVLGRDLGKIDDRYKGTEWIEIGFQGEDPTSDFRGTGELGLQNLFFFVISETKKSRNMVEEANSPNQHYFFACAGINITHKILFMLSEEKVRIHDLESCSNTEEAVHRFNLIYSKFFEDFHEYWMNSSLSNSIMNFNAVLSEFCEKYKKGAI